MKVGERVVDVKGLIMRCHRLECCDVSQFVVTLRLIIVSGRKSWNVWDVGYKYKHGVENFLLWFICKKLGGAIGLRKSKSRSPVHKLSSETITSLLTLGVPRIYSHQQVDDHRKRERDTQMEHTTNKTEG